MKAKTRLFGEIEIAEEKIITMEQGIIGFPEYKNFTLIYDSEKEQKSIQWLQSMDEGDFALPVMKPDMFVPNYSLNVDEELLAPLGALKDEDAFILVTVTVPENIENISINLKAPIIINMANNKACQIIAADDYPVKYKIYELIQKGREKAGE